MYMWLIRWQLYFPHECEKRVDIETSRNLRHFFFYTSRASSYLIQKVHPNQFFLKTKFFCYFSIRVLKGKAENVEIAYGNFWATSSTISRMPFFGWEKKVRWTALRCTCPKNLSPILRNGEFCDLSTTAVLKLCKFSILQVQTVIELVDPSRFYGEFL